VPVAQGLALGTIGHENQRAQRDGYRVQCQWDDAVTVRTRRILGGLTPVDEIRRGAGSFMQFIRRGRGFRHAQRRKDPSHCGLPKANLQVKASAEFSSGTGWSGDLMSSPGRPKRRTFPKAYRARILKAYKARILAATRSDWEATMAYVAPNSRAGSSGRRAGRRQ
jgi:hypothetical protein